MIDAASTARARELMMAALDGELQPGERQELDALLGRDRALSAEWERLTRVKEATSTMMFKQPPEETWDRYWASVYNRTERKVAWLLAGSGALLLVAYGLWHAVPGMVEALFGASDLPVVVRAGIVALLTGALLLIVSVLREQLSGRRTDRYDKGVSR
jgi:anti-sigma factor RsiW